MTDYEYEQLSCIKLVRLLAEVYASNRKQFAFALYVLANPTASNAEIARHFKRSASVVRNRMLTLAQCHEEFAALLALRDEVQGGTGGSRYYRDGVEE